MGTFWPISIMIRPVAAKTQILFLAQFTLLTLQQLVMRRLSSRKGNIP